MGMKRVSVRRERPMALAWAIALAVTMLVVYVLTLDLSRPDVVESVAAALRVTQRLQFEELERWCVSLGSWDTAGDARIGAAGYADQGAAGRVCEIDGKWQAIGALYENERDARRVVERLKKADCPRAEVICLDAEQVDMRITAPQLQIDRIEAINALIRNQIEQLDDMALQLDRDKLQPDSAKALCAVASGEAEDAARTLESIPGASENELCVGLIVIAEQLAQQQNSIAKAKGASSSALSGMLRLAETDAFLSLRELQTGMLKG